MQRQKDNLELPSAEHQAIESSQAGVETWKYKAKNSLMYYPEGEHVAPGVNSLLYYPEGEQAGSGMNSLLYYPEGEQAAPGVNYLVYCPAWGGAACCALALPGVPVCARSQARPQRGPRLSLGRWVHL